nr:PHP domain-containing protein [Actinomycetota bacterium]
MSFASRDAFPARGGVDDKTDDRFPVGGARGLRHNRSPAGERNGPAPYAELHAHSAYSFLDGASLPEELAARAAELGYESFALTDHDGVYGSLEF